MKNGRRKAAFALAFALTATSVPANSLVLAQEETAEAATVQEAETAAAEEPVSETAAEAESEAATEAQTAAEAAVGAVAETEALAEEEELVLEAAEEPVTITALAKAVKEAQGYTLSNTPETCSLDNVTENLKKTAVTVSYTDGTAETVTDWSDVFAGYREDTGAEILGLCAYTQGNILISLRLCSADGSVVSIDDGVLEPGSYTLELYAAGKKVSSQEVEITDNTDNHTCTLEFHEEVAATCTADGEKAYWSCTKCGKLYADDDMTEELAAPVAIPATGIHSYGDWTDVSEATVFAAKKQVHTCTVCGAQETQSVDSALTPTMTVPATNLKMQTKQKTTAFKVTDMANGDSLVSVTSSNKKIVKVSKVNANGTFKLTAQKKAGKAKITITLASGLTKTVKITVQKAKVKTTKISGVEKKATLQKGETLKLSPTIAPATSQDKVTYASSNKKVATVSAKGVVKAKKKGKATITIKSGKKTLKCKITVK